jgi:hypothetical protein
MNKHRILIQISEAEYNIIKEYSKLDRRPMATAVIRFLRRNGFFEQLTDVSERIKRVNTMKKNL